MWVLNFLIITISVVYCKNTSFFRDYLHQMFGWFCICFLFLKVLRILEGDLVMDINCVSTPGYDVGSRSGRIWAEKQQHQQCVVPLVDEALGDFGGKLNLENLRSTFWERDKARRTSCEDDL